MTDTEAGTPLTAAGRHEHRPGVGRDAKGRAVCLVCRRKIVDGINGWRLG